MCKNCDIVSFITCFIWNIITNMKHSFLFHVVPIFFSSIFNIIVVHCGLQFIDVTLTIELDDCVYMICEFWLILCVEHTMRFICSHNREMVSLETWHWKRFYEDIYSSKKIYNVEVLDLGTLEVLPFMHHIPILSQFIDYTHVHYKNRTSFCKALHIRKPFIYIRRKQWLNGIWGWHVIMIFSITNKKFSLTWCRFLII